MAFCGVVLPEIVSFIANLPIKSMPKQNIRICLNLEWVIYKYDEKWKCLIQFSENFTTLH